MRTTSAAPEPGAIKLWDTPEKIPTSTKLRWEKNAVRLDGQPLRENVRVRDLVLRATVLLNPDAKTPHIRARVQTTAKGDLTNRHYYLGVSADFRFLALGAIIEGQRKDLQMWPMPRPPGPDAWLRMELRIVRDEITVSADGKVLGTIRDSTVPDAGAVVILATAAGYFRDIAYVPLDKHATVAAASSTPPVKSTFATATKDAPFVNSLGMEFVPVPIIGGPSDGQRVLFSIWETRVQDFEVFAVATKYEWKKPTAFAQGSTDPAVVVMDEAQAFCAWLTERERKTGRLGATERYRLPGDHEWSCAAGIGEREDAAKLPIQKNRKITDVFPCGTAWPPPPGAGNYRGEEGGGPQDGGRG